MYDPVDNVSTTCEGNNCIGGFSRLFSAIMELKKHKPNSIVLNAGDNFQGTLWYIVHKWNVTQHFLNKLPLDAITLGNHEFDDGIDGLVPYLQHIQAPVIVSNINTNLEPRLDNLYRRSVIIERDGKKIGIIGALTTTTSSTSRTENVLFANELDSVYNEAKRLEQEVFANIVLSHCGYNLDLEMARNSSSKIRVIVGGHTDTFLYTGSPIPGPDKPSGPYPTIVLNKSGDKVLVVQASAYTKYLGNLTVFFDNFANVVGWDGAPIFLDDNNIHSDVRIDAELALWKEAVNLQGKKIVGTTINTMLNQPCRSEECPLGNFATDAMLYNYQSTLDNFCNNTVIAAIHAGGIRAGIEEGNITFYQLTTTFPFQDTINICDIKGEHLKEILESFINNDHLKFPHLLQMAGLHVVFNISNPEGGRVETLKTCCSQFENISCEDIILEKDYRVLLPTFLTDTSFNPLFQKYIKNKIIGDLDSNVYTKYLKIKSPLMQGVEGRIKIIQ
ncbi:apyrase-like isoform X5 [Zophobas morio]|uniref:apyrase-like isoform X5 n=1 Tax=Zophobas morio TaxID=2755281 RepID=UPI0030836242